MPKRRFKLKKKETSGTTIGIIFLVAIVAVGGLIFYYAASRNEPNTGGIELPNYAYRTAAVTQGYVASVELKNLFEYMPCYCGCADMSHLAYNHRHLRDCFYDDAGEFSQHAAGCSTCIDIATMVWSMVNNGATPIDIRNMIDNQYSAADYPPPTNTPLPPL
jgi:hypothetical protein